ncbi:MAG: phytanoyl-CoA dioxygenase family protein [Candidatus Poribacteria bacterium]|nr:phytanoyl-CoA dioxygenase family protein [Candidatus Poribacteria bacterium]
MSTSSTCTKPKTVITDEEVQFFNENGYLILKNVLSSEEQKRLRDSSHTLMVNGNPEQPGPDYGYQPGRRTGKSTLKRIDYVVDKDDAFRVLLAHPYILRTAEKLTGPDLIPTWDAMIYKMPNEGISTPWHRDAAVECATDIPIFNVDFYLDEADHDTCVWAIPGSHRWSQERAMRYFKTEKFELPESVPVYMQPGDVLFHEIRMLHGSPVNTSPRLRRVIYYEFRTAGVENAHGPHVPEYIPLKQDVLRACIELRKQADYIPDDEEPFVYSPPAPFDQFDELPANGLESYRFVHRDYWRGEYR